jgi:hypothetical protein
VVGENGPKGVSAHFVLRIFPGILDIGFLFRCHGGIKAANIHGIGDLGAVRMTPVLNHLNCGEGSGIPGDFLLSDFRGLFEGKVCTDPLLGKPLSQHVERPVTYPCKFTAMQMTDGFQWTVGSTEVCLQVRELGLVQRLLGGGISGGIEVIEGLARRAHLTVVPLSITEATKRLACPFHGGMEEKKRE